MITIIRVLWIALFHQPSRQWKYELYQREQAKWYKRHAGIGNGPSDLDGTQKYFGHKGDRVISGRRQKPPMRDINNLFGPR